MAITYRSVKGLPLTSTEIDANFAEVEAIGDAIIATTAGYVGQLAIADTPSSDGWYFASESGTYTNAGSLVVDITTGLVQIFVSSNKTVFSKTVTPISVNPTGIIESGNQDAVSGDTAFYGIQTGVVDGISNNLDSINLFDKYSLVDGYYVNTGNSDLIANASYSTTDWIKVEPSSSYFCNQTFTFITFYNSSKVRISGIAVASQQSITTASNCEYIRFSEKTVDWDLDTIQLELGTAFTSYVEGRYNRVGKLEFESAESVDGFEYIGLADVDEQPLEPVNKQIYYIATATGTYRFYNTETTPPVITSKGLYYFKWDGVSLWTVETVEDNVVFDEDLEADKFLTSSRVQMFIGNTFTNGTVNGLRVDFSEAEQPSSKSFGASTSTINNGMMSALKKIKNIFGAEPKMKILYKSNNLTVNQSCVVRSKASTNEAIPILVGGYLGDFRTLSVDLPITDDTTEVNASVIAQQKTITSATAWLEVYSFNIYYDNEEFNKYLNAELVKSETAFYAQFKPIDLENANGIRINRAEDNVINITIPKGTTLVARDIILPLEGFAYPILENKVNDRLSIEMITTGDYNYLDVFDYQEWVVATATSFSNISTQNADSYSNYYEGGNSSFMILQAQESANWHSQYNYKTPRLTLGSISNFTATEDIHLSLKVKIRSFNEAFTTENQIQNLKEKVNRLQRFIGDYEVDSEKACLGIVDSTLPIGATLITDGFNIPNGVLETGTSLDYLFRSERFKENGLINPTFSLLFQTNKFLEADLTLTAGVYTEKGIKIQDAVLDYGEIYNGVLGISFELFEVVSNINRVVLRVEITSADSTGLDLYLADSRVLNIPIFRPLAERVFDLDYGTPDLVAISSGGNKFKLNVDDAGAIFTTPYSIEKMLVMAHSWGLINSSPSVGWYGDWSLASSTYELGLHPQIETAVKTVLPEFTTELYRFATFGQFFKDPSSWEQYNCSHLDFDSIAILSFVASPSDGDWTGFGNALVTLMNTVVCAGKTGVKIYIAAWGGVPLNEIQIAANAFGTDLIDSVSAESGGGNGWAWKMPVNPEFPTTPILKVPANEPATPTTMNGNTLGHPSNFGYYQIGQRVKNAVCLDYALTNPNPTELTFDQYKVLPANAPYLDPLYPY